MSQLLNNYYAELYRIVQILIISRSAAITVYKYLIINIVIQASDNFVFDCPYRRRLN